MANNPFSKPSISGYNASPPTDDGAQTEANKITWAKHKTKIGDPIKTLVETGLDNTETAFAKTINTDANENNVVGGGIAYTAATYTIASGAITPSRRHCIVAAESGTADDLDQIVTTNLSDGAEIVIRPDSGDTITVRHAQGAAGQIHFADTIARALSGNMSLTLQRRGADWYDIAEAKGVGTLLQRVYTSNAAVATGTTTIPNDNSIPQNTEGDEYLTLAITPKSASSILYIEFEGQFAVATSAQNITVALFRDSVADALAAVGNYTTASQSVIGLRHRMTSPGVTSTTFKIRAGGTAGNTVTFNGSAGTRAYGGVSASSLTISEYSA